MDESPGNRQIFDKAFDKKRTVATYGGLLVFGVAYDRLVGRAEEKGIPDGFISDLIVFGATATIAALWPLIGLRKAALVLGAFAASGLPMIWGSKRRSIARRDREDERFWTGPGQNPAIGECTGKEGE
jgi:hypothetical protein